MKRFGNLFEDIVNIDNIIKAHMNARKGKTHYHEVKMVDDNPIYYAHCIRDMLVSDSYEVGKYDIFTKTVDNGKVRQIYRLDYYPHRIIHHAIMQVLEPIWVKSFVSSTYCCIKNRGIHKALFKIKHDLFKNQNLIYCFKLDIKKYYPNINNDILKGVLRNKIKDQKVLNLLDNIIDSSQGLPIGNYLSQYFSNLYLNSFDHYCKESLRLKYYYRYCDDIVIFHEDKNFLHNIRVSIKIYLNDKLKLQVKENWQVFKISSRGVDFLGYRFFHKYILLRKSIAKKAKIISQNIQTNKYASKSNIRSLMSYYGWMIHANTYNLRKKVYNDQVFKIVKNSCKKYNIKNPLQGRS